MKKVLMSLFILSLVFIAIGCKEERSVEILEALFTWLILLKVFKFNLSGDLLLQQRKKRTKYLERYVTM